MCSNASITEIFEINNIYMYWIKSIYIVNIGDSILYT